MSTSARGCPPNQASQVGRPRKRASTPQVSFEALQGGSGVSTCLPTANRVTRPWPPTGVRAGNVRRIGEGGKGADRENSTATAALQLRSRARKRRAARSRRRERPPSMLRNRRHGGTRRLPASIVERRSRRPRPSPEARTGQRDPTVGSEARERLAGGWYPQTGTVDGSHRPKKSATGGENSTATAALQLRSRARKRLGSAKTQQTRTCM